MRVIITPEAQRQYKKLPVVSQAKIKRKLDLLETHPLIGKKLEGELVGRRSLKAWPYRIVYLIDEKQKTLYVVSIVHRQGAYR